MTRLGRVTNLCKHLIPAISMLLALQALAAVAAVTPDQQAIGTITSWQTQDGPDVVEHFAAQGPTGDLLVFWCANSSRSGCWRGSPQADWQFVNVSAITGQKIASPVTSWQSEDGPYVVEHLPV